MLYYYGREQHTRHTRQCVAIWRAIHEWYTPSSWRPPPWPRSGTGTCAALPGPAPPGESGSGSDPSRNSCWGRSCSSEIENLCESRDKRQGKRINVGKVEGMGQALSSPCASIRISWKMKVFGESSMLGGILKLVPGISLEEREIYGQLGPHASQTTVQNK